MHEMMFAQKIIDEAERAGAKRAAKVEIGELCEITASELREGLQRLSSGVLDPSQIIGKGVLLNSGAGSGIEFEVKEVLSNIKCSCGYEGRAEVFERGHGYCLFRCAKCKKSGKEVEVLEGGEIRIVEVE